MKDRYTGNISCFEQKSCCNELGNGIHVNVNILSSNGTSMNDLLFVLSFYTYGARYKVRLRKDQLLVRNGSYYALLNEKYFSEGWLACDVEILEYCEGWPHNLRPVTLRCITDIPIGGCPENFQVPCDCEYHNGEGFENGFKITFDKVERLPDEESGGGDIPVPQGELYFADEEDMTLTKVNNKNTFKFKDRDTEKGKGYIILRAEKPLAEQMVQENTIYEVRYDFDLDEETLEVPADCVLEFKGGSFSNGTLEGNNTGIIANPTKIFGVNLSVSGTWQIDFAYAEWFGAVADGSTDCWDAITKALNLPPYNCKLLKGVYCISKTIELSDKKKLSGQQGDTTLIKPTTGATMDCMILVGESTNDNFSVYGHLRDLGIERAPNIGLKCYGATQGFNIENIDIKWSKGAALVVSKCWYSTYRNINCWYNNYGLILCDADNISGDTAVNGVKFDNCWFNHNTAGSVYSNGLTTAVSFNACTFENSKTSGKPEIKCEHFYTDMTFNSCYMETDRCGFDIKPDYRVGCLNIFGGFYSFRKPTTVLADIGMLDTFNVIGSMWAINDVSGMSGKCINSDASINNTSSRFPDTPNVWNATGNVISLNLNGGLYDKYLNCQSRTWQTNGLRVTHDGFARNGCSAKMYIGINRPKVHGYEYGLMGLQFDLKTTGTAINDRAYLKVIRSNWDASDIEETNVMTINHYGDLWVGRLKGHITPNSGTSRPAYSSSHIGMMYFDTNLGKPIFMKDNGVWVDATGTEV